MWALMCLTPPFVCLSQTQAEPADTAYAVVLEEVAVQASTKINKADGASYLPTAANKRVSTSGIDLLTKMRLPGILVNHLTGEVTLSGGGTVKLLINGVDASRSEIAAIRPADVVRIEYHDTPGAKYDGGDAVIDFIVRHRESGGNISAETMNAVGSGKWALFDNIAASYHNGASSVAMNAGLFGMRRDNWVRDYEETWHYPDGPVTRTETGLPVSIGSLGVDVGLSFVSQSTKSYYFNAKVGYSDNNVPNKEEGDRHSILNTTDFDEPVEIREHTSERVSSPSLGLFYRRYFGATHTLTANVSASYTRSKLFHSYKESVAGESSEAILSDVSGRKYSLFAEAYYDWRCGSSRLTVGARHSQSLTSNSYTGNIAADVRIRQFESSVFGQYDVRLGRVGLTANIAGVRLQSRQGEVNALKYTANASAGISYDPVDNFRARYDARIYSRQPQLSAMNDVGQQVQPGLVRVGNPNLKAYHIVDQRINLAYQHPIVSVDLMLDWRDERNPVMPSTSWDGSRFVIYYDNQRSFKELRGELSVAVRPWGDHLSIALSPALSRYFSYGNSYTHIRNIFHLGVSVDFNYGNWVAGASVMTGNANSMYGEEIIHEKDMNMLLVGYKMPRWTLQIGIFNAFMREYWMKSENMSALTPFQSKAHCGKNAYGVVKFSLNLDFGRGRQDADIMDTFGPAEPDSDSGIMDSTK